MKRIISILLTLCLLLGNFAPAVYAQEPQSDASVQTDDITIEGTNGFGNLLSAEIVEAQEEQAESYEGGYTITDLVIEGNTATVTYDALGEANLIVALYTEDGLQLLNSANTTVTAEETEATVTFAGEMPEYFLARVYMMDNVDYTPMSQAYETPLYTQDMQELLSSTVEDYDPELVVNFDDDPTTNFAVYKEGTVIVDEVEGVNIITSNDDENLLYIIENADETFTSLQPGDVVSYFYGEEDLLLCKVGSVTVDGTTVTIHGDGTPEMEDVFDYVKVDQSGDTSDFTSTDTDPNDGISLLDPSSQTPLLYSTDDDVTIRDSYTYNIDKKELPTEEGSLITAKISGDITLAFTLKAALYHAKSYTYLRLKLDYSLSLKLSASGKITLPLENFCHLTLLNTGLFRFTLSPTFKFILSGEVDISAAIKGTIGFVCESGKDVVNLNTNPKFEAQAEVSSAITASLDFQPEFTVIHKKIAAVVLNIPLRAVAQMQLYDRNIYEDSLTGTIADSVHECKKCLEGKVYWEISVDFSVKILKLTHRLSIGLYRSDEIKFYKSLTYDVGGIGSCPYKLYLVIFEAVDAEDQPIKGAQITVADLVLNTDEEGLAYAYLGKGSHNVTVSINERADSFMLKVNGTGQKMTLILDESTMNFTGIMTDTMIDHGLPVLSGSAGDNITYNYYATGLLELTGFGPMKDFSVNGILPGYKITKIIFDDAITSIGKYAFYGKDSLTEVEFGTGLQTIGERAFCECDGLTNIELPEGLTSIGQYAFYYCRNLSSVYLPETLKSIEVSAFGGCGLTSVDIPASIDTLADTTFFKCSNLTEVHVPEGITSVGEAAFGNCSNLKKVIFPDTVTSFGENVFQNCSGLTEVNIPDGVTAIPSGMFQDCSSLTEILIPASVAEIGSNAFSGCSSLTYIDIPYGVTAVADGTFIECESLASVHLPETIVEIGNHAFNGCSALHNITLPNGVTTIGTYAFDTSRGLEAITFPASVTYIGYRALGTYLSTHTITFEGDAPTFDGKLYYSNSKECIAYYPSGNETWTEEVMKACGSGLTWTPYTLDEDGNIVPDSQSARIIPQSTQDISDAPNETLEEPTTDGTEESISGEAPTLGAIYGGEYSAEDTGEYILRTASFSGLKPGAEYLLLAMVTTETDTPLAPENLLFIYQAAADKDGTLSFQYVQRVTTDPSYVFACGASNKSLADASITFPEMEADGELHAVEPVVTYEGKKLQEGRDYEITGTVSYTEAGTYVCYIRGIHNYTGTMKCTYTVAELEEPEIPTDPTDPEEPTDPTKPTEPGEPTDPVDPEDPALEGVIRIAGSDRIATSLMLAAQLKEVLRVEKFDAVVVASALNFPDALTGSYLAAVKDAPILLTYPAAHAKIRAYIQENLKPGGMVYILGGEGAVSADFANGLGSFNIKRLAGSDRFGTNLEIMKEAGNYDGKPVLIATATNFADSLSASAAGLPMVLVYGSLREDQKEFLATTSRNFIIIGGEAAVSKSLENELAAIGTVERLAGDGRYQTSVMVARKFVQNPDDVVLAYARNFPDGLCGGPLAYALGAPLILTDNHYPGEADKYVDGISAGILVGGAGLISDETVALIFDK